MGKTFEVVYDDFTGGHFVGPSQANQPRNTWVGANIICTADEGFLMPDAGWTRSTANWAGASTTWPTLTDATLTFAVAGTAIKFVNVVSEATLTGAIATADLAAHVSDAYFPDNAANEMLYSGGVDATPVRFNVGAWRWKEWYVGASTTVPYVYFTAPSATTWAAGDYIQLGTGGNRILTMVPQSDDLLVGTAEGWFSISGVLGETTVVRRISAPAMSVPSGAPSSMTGTTGSCSAITGQGVLHTSASGSPVRLLRGTQVVGAVHSPEFTAAQFMTILPNDAHAVIQYGSTFWIWSDVHNRWRKSLAPTAAEAGVASVEYRCAAGGEGCPYIAATVVHAGTTVYFVRTPKEPLQPVETSGVFNTATVTLAEFSQNRPFKVVEVLAEVDFGQPATQAGVRSLTAQVVTNTVADTPSRFAREVNGDVTPWQTTAFSRKWDGATATKIGDREMVRFRTSDGPATYTAAPKVSLQGVKLRRLIMVCEEA